MRLYSITSILSLILLTACGYMGGQGGTLETYDSITIPYVEGDWDGSITATLIKRMTASGVFRYQNTGGALTLQVKILDYVDEQIGYQYDRHKDGEPRKVVIPDETRTTIIAEVAVVETASGSSVLGPVRLSADVEYDHDYYNTRHHVNVFSLGQLTDIDSAYDAAQRPLNEHLAKKIVDYVTSNW